MPTFDPDVEKLLELGRKAGRPPFEANRFIITGALGHQES